MNGQAFAPFCTIFVLFELRYRQAHRDIFFLSAFSIKCIPNFLALICLRVLPGLYIGQKECGGMEGCATLIYKQHIIETKLSTVSLFPYWFIARPEW